MNFYATSALVAYILTLSVGILVWWKAKDRAIGRLFALVSFSVSLWVLGCFGEADASAKWATSFDIVLYIGACFAPTLFMHFVFAFSEKLSERRAPLIGSYAVSIFFLIFNLNPDWRHFFVRDVARKFSYRFIAEPGPLWYVFAIWYVVVVAIFLVDLFEEFKRASSEHRQRQFQYFLTATTMLAIAGTMYFGLVLTINMPMIDNFFTSAYALMMAYSILNHRLMDITIVIQRTLVYGSLVAGLGALYFGILYVAARTLEPHLGMPPVISSFIAVVLLMIAFHPVRARVQSYVDRHFTSERANRLSVELRDEILHQYSGSLTHEIKGPLAHIMAPAELALMEIEDVNEGKKSFSDVAEKMRGRLEYILKCVVEANERFAAVRELSDSNAEKVPVTLKAIVDAAVGQLRTIVQETGSTVKNDLEPAVSAVLGYPKQLEIVFINLIKNALEAGAKTVTIIAERQGKMLGVRVIDDGSGLPEDQLKKLFERGFTTKGTHGTGVGLFLCRQIVERHGGNIKAESDSARTYFIISLPIR